MPTYTPGPWKWFNYPNETKLLAAPSCAVIHCPDGPMGITPEDQALIAAAPDLFAALKALRIDANRLCDRELGGTYEEDCRRAITVADEAIAKATWPTERRDEQ